MKEYFTSDEIDGYLKEKVFGYYYKNAKDIAEEMATHADGKFPEKLLYTRRPNEPLEVMEYRKTIFTAKTKPTFTKILSSLQKIRRSADWSIKYSGEFGKIAEEETLENYCEYNFPGFTSVTNWIFTVMLRKYLIDPNAVVFVSPGETNIPENEYTKPVAHVYDSCHVIDFEQDDFAVLVNPLGAVYYVRDKPNRGKRYWFATTKSIEVWDQVNTRGQFERTQLVDHNLDALPVFQLKGMLIEQVLNYNLYESRISGVIPELDEAVREYSDLQAAKVLHIYPERWEFTQNECTSCKGTGKRSNPLYTGPGCGCEAHTPCDKCVNGYTVAGPYSKIIVRPMGVLEQGGSGSIPNPPAGYVEKDVEIVKIMEESIERHIYNALSAINFEFLSKTPLSESGVAKEVDKDELNNTVHSIAEDIVSAMDNIYWFIAKYRYGLLYNDEKIAEMVPQVTVPEKYDILSSSHLQEELKGAKESKFNPVLLNAMEKEYASKKFNTDPEVSDMVQLVLNLDPLPNISEDDKMSRLSNQGITQETYVISSNIQEFVRRAIEENKGFAEMEVSKQKEIMVLYAQEEILKAQPVQTDAGLDENGQPIASTDDDITGKIPLAVQQLSLAATRASDAGDTALAATIKAKINQLLGKLVDEVKTDAV